MERPLDSLDVLALLRGGELVQDLGLLDERVEHVQDRVARPDLPGPRTLYQESVAQKCVQRQLEAGVRTWPDSARIAFSSSVLPWVLFRQSAKLVYWYTNSSMLFFPARESQREAGGSSFALCARD